MTRDDGWRLLSTGRHVERLGFLAQALSSAFETGAVFDEGGIHVGMLGRRSTTPDANYIRATRSTFIVEQLQATFDTLEPEVQEAVALYLEAE